MSIATLAWLACLAAAQVSAPGAPPPAAGRAVRTLTLEEALGELDARSPSLAQARSRADEASAIVRQAAAPLLPTLTASGSYTQYRDEVKFQRLPPAGPVLIQPEKAWGASYALRVPLLVPSAWGDLSAARHAAGGAEASARAARDGLRLAVVQGAWMASSAEEVLAAAERALATARDQAASARRAVEAGLQPPLSALASETQAVRREGDRVRAGAALDRSRLALGVLLGRAEAVRIALPAPLPGAAPEGSPALATLIPEAVSRRPEVRARAEQAAAAASQVTSARLRFLPQISAAGSYFSQDVALPTGHKDGWRVGVELTWPLYDGGLRYGKLREAAAAAEGARAAELAERLVVAQEVEDAARDLSVAAERLRLATQQRALAADAAATARRGFEAGTTGNVEVLSANDELFQAEVGLAEARAGLGGARASLDRATGRL